MAERAAQSAQQISPQSSILNPQLRRAAAVALALSLLVSSPARASTVGFPDTDTVALGAIVYNAIKQTAELGSILASIQSGMQTARSTLAVLRAASDTVNEFRYLSEHPDEILRAAEEAFGQVFPEVDGIKREAAGLMESLREGPNGELNPYALQQLLNEIGNTQWNFYDTVIAMDEALYGLSEGHVSLLKQQDLLAVQGQGVFRETMDPGCRAEIDVDGNPITVCGLDQKRASVLGAKAQAISAASLGIIGKVITEQLRLAKLEAIRKLDDGARTGATRLDHARGLAMVTASVDETLDPTKDDATAQTFVDRPPGGTP